MVSLHSHRLWWCINCANIDVANNKSKRASVPNVLRANRLEIQSPLWHELCEDLLDANAKNAFREFR